MRSLFLNALIAFAILHSGWAAAAVVKEIEIRQVGEGPFDKGFVEAQIEHKVGMQFERYALTRDVKAIMKTGRFSDVRVYVSDVGEDVKIIYKIENRLILMDKIEIRGEDRFADYHIRGLLGLEPGDYIDDTVLGRRALKVKEEYASKHYPDVEADWKIIRDPERAGYARVVFTVKEGGKAKVGAVSFSGNQAFSGYDLGRLFKRPAWWNPFWWTRKRKFDEQEVFEGRMAVREKYHEAGYLDVEVGKPEYSRSRKGVIEVRLDLNEGRQFYINRILLSGVDKFPETAVRKVIKLKTGDLASSSAIRNAVAAVRDFYGSRGYIETVTRPVLKPVGDSEKLDLTIEVTEGHLCYIRGIDIEGNIRTRDKVVRRELLVSPGDIYNEVKVRASEHRLMNLGYFANVRSFSTHTEFNDERNLVIELEEGRTGQFMFGAGFSSIDRATLFLEVAQSNFDLFNWPHFTGGGQKLKVNSQFGSTRRDFLVSFIEPWFLDRKLRFGFSVYDRLIKYDDYDSRRTGGSISLGQAVSQHGRVNLRYALERLQISDIADTNEYLTEVGGSYYFREEKDSVSSSMQLSYTYDRRNNPFVPTKGDRFTVTTGVTGGPFGFDNDFYEVGVGYTTYIPMWNDHVLNLKARYDSVEEFGDSEEVPIDDRLFAGGGRTLRGFKYRDVGPKVTREVDLGNGLTDTYRKPMGGGSRFLATAEYSIPLAKPMRFAFFADAGNVWWEPYEVDLADLAMSWGGGMRFDLPGFPIRIDYADVIRKDDELTRSDAWVFYIGYDF